MLSSDLSVSRIRPYSDVMPGSCSRSSREAVSFSRMRGRPSFIFIVTAGSVYTPLVSYIYTGAFSVITFFPLSILTVGVRLTRRIATLIGNISPSIYIFSEPGYELRSIFSMVIIVEFA